MILVERRERAVAGDDFANGPGRCARCERGPCGQIAAALDRVSGGTGIEERSVIRGIERVGREDVGQRRDGRRRRQRDATRFRIPVLAHPVVERRNRYRERRRHLGALVDHAVECRIPPGIEPQGPDIPTRGWLIEGRLRQEVVGHLIAQRRERIVGGDVVLRQRIGHRHRVRRQHDGAAVLLRNVETCRADLDAQVLQARAALPVILPLQIVEVVLEAAALADRVRARRARAGLGSSMKPHQRLQ